MWSSLLQALAPVSTALLGTQPTCSLGSLAQAWLSRHRACSVGPCLFKQRFWLFLGVGGPLTPQSLAEALKARPLEEGRSREPRWDCPQW